MRNPYRHLALLTCLTFLLVPAIAEETPPTAEETPPAAEAGEEDAALTPKEIVERATKSELDASRAVQVTNERFQIEALDLTLESGILYFSEVKPGDERPTGAYFIGQGRFVFNPPTEIDRFMLDTKIETESVDATFTEAFFNFSGERFNHLVARLAPSTGGQGDKAASSYKSRWEALNSIPVASAGVLGMPPRPEWGEYFAVSADLQGYGWVWYVRDPNATKENVVWQELNLGLGQTYFDYQDAENFWGQFNDQADLDKIARGQMDPGRECKDRLQMEHVEMDLTIAKGSLLVKEKAKVTFTSLYDDETLTYFELIWDPEGNHRRIKVLSLQEDGEDLPFYHGRNILLIGLNRPTKAGEQRTIELEAELDIVRPIQSNLYKPSWWPSNQEWPPPNLDTLNQDFQAYSLLNTYAWFPQHGFLQRYSIDWNIRVPKPIIAVASGTTAERREEEGYNYLHTVEKEKIALASILLGRFKTFTDDTKRPVIHVHALPRQVKVREGLAKTVRNIIDLYEERLGPFPYDEIDLGQMSFFFGFGQAPPGLVQLTGEAFLSDSEISTLLGGDPTFKWAFIAHETGHQWWGHVTSWASPEDQWLSESFTEYMSGLYLMALKGFGQPAFETQMREWKQRADLSKDKGPISEGFRTGGFHYQNQTYFKGPMVLHMFRQALMAEYGDEVGNDMFFETLREFLAGHRHQNATTLDFQRTVKEVTGLNMDWFFDQWYRGVGVPTINWTYEVRQTEDGKYLVEGEVRQELSSGEAKALLVPFYFHYGKEVSQPEYRVTWNQQMEPMAAYPVRFKVAKKPTKVTVDDFKSLLGELTTK